MDSVVRPHFSGLRLDSRRPSSSSLPNSPSPASGNGAADANGFASPTKADGTRQPFVIGTRLAATGPAAWLPRLEFSACPDPRFFLTRCAVGFAGVSGGTASGKKTVCDMIIQQLHDHRVVLVNQVRIFFPFRITYSFVFAFGPGLRLRQSKCLCIELRVPPSSVLFT
jgi:uridine kinase